MRFFVTTRHRTIVSIIMLCCALTPARATHAMDPVTGTIVVALGSYLVEKTVLDPLWDEHFVTGEKRMDILQERLSLFESNLGSVDQKLANEVATFRKQISKRTTPQEVRKIVRYALAEVEKRLGKVEARVELVEKQVNNLDSRVRNLEEAVFPGGFRSCELDGQKYIAKADVFQFARTATRQWRDKQHGPLVRGRLVEVSPDGVVIKETVSGTEFRKLVKWHRLSVSDQHYINASVSREGLPVNAQFFKVKPATSKDTSTTPSST